MFMLKVTQYTFKFSSNLKAHAFTMLKKYLKYYIGNTFTWLKIFKRLKIIYLCVCVLV